MTNNSKSWQKLGDELLEWYSYYGSPWKWRPSATPFQVYLGAWLESQGIMENDVINSLIKTCPTPEDLVAIDAENIAAILIAQRKRGIELVNVGQYLLDNFNGEIPTTLRTDFTDIFINDWIADEVEAYGFNHNILVRSPDPQRALQRISCTTSYINLGQIFEALNSPERSQQLNTALTLLSRFLCARIQPKCLLCPLQAHCDYKAGNRIV